MGHWDYQAIELFAHDSADAVLAAFPSTQGFHGHGVILFQGRPWLHCGWDDGNVTAYQAMVTFCQRTGRRWITSYAIDTRATRDAAFFGNDPTQRAARLHALFGAPTPCPEEERRPDQ
ncbi:MAG: hypothetical protein HOP18_17060 [Deltaproteobacteria bacterium]|nr:hypothetical protein [Deltaproteobacteria bacterium]